LLFVYLVPVVVFWFLTCLFRLCCCFLICWFRSRLLFPDLWFIDLVPIVFFQSCDLMISVPVIVFWFVIHWFSPCSYFLICDLLIDSLPLFPDLLFVDLGHVFVSWFLICWFSPCYCIRTVICWFIPSCCFLICDLLNLVPVVVSLFVIC